MPSILVLYDTQTGHTRTMAEAVADGARAVPGTEVVLKHVDEAHANDLLESDGVAVGSPTWCGLMTWKLKRFFDESISVWGKVEDKVGCAFSSVGAHGGGAEMTCLSILNAMINYGMLVFGVTDKAGGFTAHYGAVAAGEPSPGELAMCRLLGEKLVQHVQRVNPDA